MDPALEEKNMNTLSQRLQWFQAARFGIFIHWGIYSVLGRGEQIMSRDLMPLEEYEPLAAEFNPPSDWAKKLAEKVKASGAKYAVLTTRHHDGYCLFKTATTPFNAAETGPERDLVREYVDTFREAGLRIGFYYSIMNWRRHGFWDAEHYPADLPKLVEEIHRQVEELMTNYGKIDILWYDVSAVPGSRTPGLWLGSGVSDNAADFYRSGELNRRVRELQPEILINNRAGTAGDFTTPEQFIQSHGDLAWETCMTLNPAPGWGFLKKSLTDKTVNEVIFNMMDAVRLGGNFLLNVGPDSSGSIDRREGPVLEQIGSWLSVNGEAVYNTMPEGIYDLSAKREQGPCFHYGIWTCRGKTAYLTLFYYPEEYLVVSKIRPEIKKAVVLKDGRELNIEQTSNSRSILRGLPASDTIDMPPVIRVEFAAPPQAVNTRTAAWLDGGF
jgi:alpha-L-fucosidase